MTACHDLPLNGIQTRGGKPRSIGRFARTSQCARTRCSRRNSADHYQFNLGFESVFLLEVVSVEVHRMRRRCCARLMRCSNCVCAASISNRSRLNSAVMCRFLCAVDARLSKARAARLKRPRSMKRISCSCCLKCNVRPLRSIERSMRCAVMRVLTRRECACLRLHALRLTRPSMISLTQRLRLRLRLPSCARALHRSPNFPCM